MPSLLALLAGALLLVWPAFYNGYPILFSDTGGFLDMGLLPSIGWDKPFVYGPLIAALSLRWTLWIPVLAQGLLLSYLLWAAARFRPGRHLLTCLVLAVASAAPWFASTLMPDSLTPVAVLAILLAADPALPTRHRDAATAIAAVAIAAHLSHLILAAALLAALALLRRRLPWRPLGSLAAALLFLLGSNWVAHGRPAVSPYGSVFALARLIADGPARDYLDQTCPDAGWILCRWRAHLTNDSDQFLWDPRSPFWADPAPLPEFAAEAGRIVLGTVRAEPGRVLRDAARNTARQLLRVDTGDTIGPDYLADAVRPRVARFFPAAETRRLDAARQAAGTLDLPALRPLDRAALLLAAAAAVVTLLRALRRPSPRADLTALLLVALLANALSTGALSTVHDRYQARIAWLLLLPLLLPLTPPAPPAPARGSPPSAPP